MTDSRTRVLLVFPRFARNTFWSMEAVCDVWGARALAPPLGLITLAALLPPSWEVRLVNRNAEALTEEQLGWADIVFTGGMMPQEADTHEVIGICRDRNLPVAVGGPGATSSPERYEEADFIFQGEAEGTIGLLIEAWERGERHGRFAAPKFQADVTKSPLPRFDLLDFGHYLFVGVQFSRGCPFTCEFCDIIELYGRVPRTKSTPQMLAELDLLYKLGYRGHLDFVDDNLIGNKKAVKAFLPHLADWQRKHDFPFMLSTEASLNLADDADLLRMMREANFFGLFVGIESPDTDTLVLTQKKQNTRRSIAESVHRIQAAGIMVTAGFIVGFDTEKSSPTEALLDCIEEAHVPFSIVSMLCALPNTQLQRRLDREGRLFEGYDNFAVSNENHDTFGGLNFATLRPRRDVIRDYRDVLARAYDPTAFFGRVRKLAGVLDRPSFVVGKPEWRTVRRDFGGLVRAVGRLSSPTAGIARHFWPTLIYCLWKNPKAIQLLMLNMVVYLHLGPFARHVVARLDRTLAELDAGNWTDPEIRPIPGTGATAALVAAA